MTWQRRNPSLYEKERAEIESHYPGLHFVDEGGIVFIRGSFPVMFEGQALDRYTIELQLVQNHPAELPIVRETGGRIPRHPDRHVNAETGIACVLIPDERWRLWPIGEPLLTYFTGPLHSYFLAQTIVEEGEPWPFGQWEHGARGVFQFYRELLNTSNLRVMMNYLVIVSKESLKGHWPCPCENGRKLRDCHIEEVKHLRGNISRKDARTSLAMLKAAGPCAVEMTEAKPSAASIAV